jgi:hypothetical protein
VDPGTEATNYRKSIDGAWSRWRTCAPTYTVRRIAHHCPRRNDAGHPQACKPLPLEVTFKVSKVRRGGYVFLAWKGDHSPMHVHVYRGGTLVLKWDLENWRPMLGNPSPKVLRLIRELRYEGLL